MWYEEFLQRYVNSDLKIHECKLSELVFLKIFLRHGRMNESIVVDAICRS